MVKMKVFKNRKAFSAVIASLILMLLAVAAGVVVYAYVMGWIGGAQQNTTSNGLLTIDSATASVANSQIKIYVRNSGGVNLVLDNFYISGTAVLANGTQLTSTTSKLPIQGTSCLQFSKTLTANTFYDVKVVCIDGTTVSTSVLAE
jgi:hypothetical protein